MTEEQIIGIIKLEAHKNLTIVDEGTDSYNDYVIRGVDLMAKNIVKLFAIPSVVGILDCPCCKSKNTSTIHLDGVRFCLDCDNEWAM